MDSSECIARRTRSGSECIAKRTRSGNNHHGFSKGTVNFGFGDSISVLGRKRSSFNGGKIVKKELAEENGSFSEEKIGEVWKRNQKIRKERDGDLGFGELGSVVVQSTEDLIRENGMSKLRSGLVRRFESSNGVMGSDKNRVMESRGESDLISEEATRVSVDDVKLSKPICVATRTRSKSRKQIGTIACIDLDDSQSCDDKDVEDVEANGDCNFGVMGSNENGVREGDDLIIKEETRVSVDEVKPCKLPCVAMKTRSKSVKRSGSFVCMKLDNSRSSGDDDGGKFGSYASVCVDKGGSDSGLISEEKTRVDDVKSFKLPFVAMRTRSKSVKQIGSPVCIESDDSQSSEDGDDNDDDESKFGNFNSVMGRDKNNGKHGASVCVEGGGGGRLISEEETSVSVDNVKPSKLPCVAMRTRSKLEKQIRSHVCINLDNSQSYDNDDDDEDDDDDDDSHYEDSDYIVTEGDDDDGDDDDGDDYKDNGCMVSEDDADDCRTEGNCTKRKRVCEPETVLCPTCCKERAKEAVPILPNEEETFVQSAGEETPIPFYKTCMASRTSLQSELGLKKHEGTVNSPIIVDEEEIWSFNDRSVDDSEDDVGTSQEAMVEVGEKDLHHNCESMGTRVKMRKFIRSEDTIDLEDSEAEFRVEIDQNAYISRRTRSQIDLRSKEKSQHISHPMADEGKRENNDCWDNGDSYESDSDEDEDEDEDDEHVSRENEEATSRDKKKTHSTKDDFLCELIMNTVDAHTKKLFLDGKCIPQQVAPSRNENLLPLRFSFADEDSKAKEKTDAEKEVESLWEDFDFALSYADIGSFCSSAIDSRQNTKLSESETRSSLPCVNGGEHSWICDEKIGRVCRFCKNVVLEIKYIIPPIANSSGKTGNKNSDNEVDLSKLCGIYFQESCKHSRGSGVPSSGSVWDIIPGIRGSMYPHQQEAFEFIWRNLAGSNLIEELRPDSDDVGGCVISHAPGTGKTRLTIAFLQTFMKVFPELRPIIVAPCNLLPMWKKEFEKWDFYIPIHDLNCRELSGEEDGLYLKKLKNGKTPTPKSVRWLKLYSWLKGRSILLVSYSLFEKLTGHSNKKKRELAGHGCDEAVKLMQEILFRSPGLLVLDEGHTARNKNSGIWKSLKMVKTELRIMLSGTPFQNNFDELFNTLYIVRRKFADSLYVGTEQNLEKREAKLRRNFSKIVNKIEEPREGYGEKLQLFRSTIDSFIHVHEGAILKKLPGLRDYIILLHPTPLQKSVLGLVKVSNNFELEQKVSMISLHPSLLIRCGSEEDAVMIDEFKLQTIEKNPSEGVKLRFILELIRLCIARKEKVLIFSQYLEPMSFIIEHLKSVFHWCEGRQVLQLDGTIRDVEKRQDSIDNFNNSKSEAKVLLASIKACREGINLIGASRVVLLDVVWNPSVGRQAISRAFRLGQDKFVHAYHLITSESLEETKYVRHAKKDSLSKMLFSSTDGNNAEQKIEPKVCEDDILGAIVKHDKLKDMFKDIYTPKESSNGRRSIDKQIWIGSTISDVLDNMVAVNV